jgi:hypothetical protein
MSTEYVSAWLTCWSMLVEHGHARAAAGLIEDGFDAAYDGGYFPDPDAKEAADIRVGMREALMLVIGDRHGREFADWLRAYREDLEAFREMALGAATNTIMSRHR